MLYKIYLISLKLIVIPSLLFEAHILKFTTNRFLTYYLKLVILASLYMFAKIQKSKSFTLKG